MAVIGAGIYVFDRNIPKGTYDLTVISGSGSVKAYRKELKDGNMYFQLGKSGSKTFYGLSSEEFSRFEIDGNIEIEIKKSDMIKFDD